MISWILGEFTKHAMVEPWVSPSCEGLKKTWTLHVEWFLVLVIQQKLAGNHSCQFFPVQTTDILMLDSSTIVVNFQPFCSLSGKCLNWSCFLRWNAIQRSWASSIPSPGVSSGWVFSVRLTLKINRLQTLGYVDVSNPCVDVCFFSGVGEIRFAGGYICISSL